MRVFIALELGESLVDGVEQVATRLRYSVPGRYCSPKSYHVTLAFLGEIEPERIEAVCQAVDSACEGVKGFELSLAGLGTFGRGDKRVLWQGLSPDDGVIALGGRVRAELRERGFDFDRKPLRPHVTIARDAVVRDVGYLAGIESYASGRGDVVTVFQIAGRYIPLYSRELD